MAALLPPIHSTPPPAVYLIEQNGGGLGVSIDEGVFFIRVKGVDDQPRWIADRWRRDRNRCSEKTSAGECQATDRTNHGWADSANCFELLPIVAGFGDFQRELSGSPSLQEQKAGAALTLSEYVGPLALWWRSAQPSLDYCWRAENPIVDGRPLQPSRLIQVPPLS